jgi:hypothetical protein
MGNVCAILVSIWMEGNAKEQLRVRLGQHGIQSGWSVFVPLPVKILSMESVKLVQPILDGTVLSATVGLDFSQLRDHVKSAVPTPNLFKTNVCAITAFSVPASHAQPAIQAAAHVQTLLQQVASPVPTSHTHSQAGPVH